MTYIFIQAFKNLKKIIIILSVYYSLLWGFMYTFSRSSSQIGIANANHFKHVKKKKILARSSHVLLSYFYLCRLNIFHFNCVCVCVSINKNNNKTRRKPHPKDIQPRSR